MYVISAMFIVYFATQTISPQLWNSLFWIISIFGASTAVAKSFFSESENRQLFYYQLVKPLEFIFAKIIYNFVFLLFILAASTIIFSVISDVQIQRLRTFVICLILGSMSFSIVFSFVSALASKTSNKHVISVVLSFPLLIGVMQLLIRLCAYCLGIFNDTSYTTDIIYLLCFNSILIALIIFLFPFIWRE